jgi:hypothetical protein
MTKRDFHGIEIKETHVVISKDKDIINKVSKLFNGIKSNKISDIILALLSYNDYGLSGACLKNGTLTKKEISDNKGYFFLSVNMLSQYIEITKNCRLDVLEIVFDYMHSTVNGGASNE